MPAVRSLADVLADHDHTTNESIYVALVERENQMADMLRMVGANFGLYPQFVAEALAEVGIGTPLSTEERALIHSQYHLLMEQLTQQGDDTN